MPESGFPPHAIAIIGMAGRFPGTPGLDGFWRDVRAGVETLEPFDDADLDAAGIPVEARADDRYVRKGTVLADSTAFDAGFFGFSPREAQVIDPQHRLFLECAWEAMEHGGYAPGIGDAAVGVYAGASMNTYLLNRIARNPELAASVGGYQLMLGNDKDFLCTRVSYKLGLTGPSMTIQSACSTSLVAIETACRALLDGECDMALSGGVSIMFPERAGYLFQEGMIFSPDGHCRPFDAAAAGTRAGAGAGVVLLKRLKDAERDGDTIHAVIRGIAVNNDGAAKAGYTAPSVDGQIEVIATAQALADIDPRSIGYVEAHGTATPLGDPVEFAALTRAFRAGTDDVGFCSLGSLKANLGHLDAAAGVAGLIKTVLVLKHGELPPLVNFQTPNAALNMGASPFTASGTLSGWPRGSEPRRAAVSSFGIGGTNAHAVLEEAPPLPVSAGSQGWHLLPVSAKTEPALGQMADALADHLADSVDGSLADVAWTLQAGRRPFAHRRFVVAKDAAEAAEKLGRPVAGVLHEGGARSVAFLFSGQGSQHPGMGESLYRDEPVYRAFVDRCAAVLEPLLGLDLREAMFGKDVDRLDDTRIAQPALFVTELALAELLRSWGVVPRAMLGHSIGEYAAATLAGVFDLDDALGLVAERGRLMSEMPAGSMAAVAMAPQHLAPRLAAGVEIAAINAPALCTISGPTDALAKTVATLGAEGVHVRPLHTSHAFHSGMMEPMLAAFRARVASVRRSAPAIPYVSNLSGRWITAEQATSPDYYASQLRQTVRFGDGVATLAAEGALFLLEVGPGTTLAQLARQGLTPERAPLVAPSLPHPGASSPATPSLLEAAGHMWAAGVPVDFVGMARGERRRRVPLPTYRFQRQRYDVEPGEAAPAAVTGVDGGRPRLYVPSWTRDIAVEGGALEGRWLVAGGSPTLRRVVAEAVEARGGVAVQIADVLGIAAHTEDAGAGPASGAILLDGMDDASPRAAFDSLMALGKALDLDQRPAPFRMILGTQGGQSVLDEGVTDTQAMLALGPALVLPTEMPGLRMRLVDIAPGATVGDVLVSEAARQDEEPVAAWRGGRRWIRTYTPFAGEAPLPLRRNGVYLVTGGLGGIGLALAEWLAREWGARLMLTSRTAVRPGDARAATLRAIEAAGGSVLTAVADAADEEAMRSAVETVRCTWGGIDGVIHAAGVSGTGKIAIRLDPEDIAATLAPKVEGLSVLRRVLADEALDFVALMGSINGVLGAPGAADYSAANAVLDAFAEGGERPAGWRRVLSIDWSAWGEIGMAAAMEVPAAMRDARRAQLRQAIRTEAGVASFARILASPHDRVVVTAFDLPAAIAASRPSAIAARQAAQMASRAAERPTEGPLAGGAPQTEVEAQLAAIWTELIGVKRIGRDDDFFLLGGHSLLATRMLVRVRETLGASLTLRDVFDAPTLCGLAARIDGDLAAGETSSLGDDDHEEMLL